MCMAGGAAFPSFTAVLFCCPAPVMAGMFSLRVTPRVRHRRHAEPGGEMR